MNSTVSIHDAARYGAVEFAPDREPGQDVADAAYAVAHGYPGGIRALALRMGVNANTLTAKVNQQNTTHHLSLHEAVAMQALSGNAAVLHAMADALGYTCTRMTPDQSGGEPLRAMSQAQNAFAEFVRAVVDGLDGGPAGVSPNQLRRAQHEAQEAIGAIGHALAMLRARLRTAPEAHR